jgi:DNA anti-recombination protein RmuC
MNCNNQHMNALWLRITMLLWFGTLLGRMDGLAAEDAPAEAKEKMPVLKKESLQVLPPKEEERVRQFTLEREAYLAKRAAIYERAKEMTEQQRRELRERLRLQREQQTQAREALRNQLRAMREQLPTHRELIDDARERAGSRERRGD